VLIVGGGPVGLAASLELARFGVGSAADSVAALADATAHVLGR
jgi:2-polyprenyl-6-methoxyphenol hydroxylase-like FAD-dependent oxidoreductase